MLKAIKSMLKKTGIFKKYLNKMITGGSNLKEREFIFEYIDKGGRGAEVGVWEGAFSEHILRLAEPDILFLIDSWKHEESPVYKDAWYGGKLNETQKEMEERFQNVTKKFKNEINIGRVQILRGYSSSELEKIEDDFLDWIYIDANHLYEFVKKDLDIARKKVKNGGIIMGDDYREGGWWNGGVKKAVDELIETSGSELMTIKNFQYLIKNIKKR